MNKNQTTLEIKKVTTHSRATYTGAPLLRRTSWHIVEDGITRDACTSKKEAARRIKVWATTATRRET